mgnify:CR=1 FL=1
MLDALKYDIPHLYIIYFVVRDVHARRENQPANLLVKSFSIISKPRMKLSTKVYPLYMLIIVRSIYSTEMFI